MRFRLRFLVLFLILMACVGFVGYAFIFENEGDIITIYHTNDVHGALNSVYDESGKLTQIGLDVIKSLKDHTENAVLLDAGDFSQGKGLANRTRGQKACELMKAAGYDAVTLGNHELDEGVQNLLSNISKSEIDVLSCNVFKKEKNDLLLKSPNSNGDHKIIEICNKKIGIFGITTVGTLNSTSKKNTENLIFKDEIEESKKQVEKLKRENCDVIIAVAHMGDEEAVTSKDIALSVNGIDIIIDGHSHKVYREFVGHTCIVQTGIYSTHIGKIEIEFKKNGTFKIFPSTLDSDNLQDPSSATSLKIPQDLKIKKIIDKELETISKTNNEVVGYTPNTIYGGNYKGINISRLCGCGLGDLIADAILHNTDRNLRINSRRDNTPLVSIMNGGGIRTSIDKGKITFADILNVVPFKNKIVAKIVTPKKLYQILENGVKSMKFGKNNTIEDEETAFPDVAGMRIVVDIKNEPCEIKNKKIIKDGSRIKKIYLLAEDGTDKCVLKRDDDITKIIVSAPDFMTDGGDGYVAFKDTEALKEGDSGLGYIYDILREYIEYLMTKEGKVVGYSEGKNRIQILSYVDNKNFNCNIKVLNFAKPLKNSKVLIKVDEQNPCTYVTDKDGKLILKNLSEGSHNININYENRTADSYVNNLLGINFFDINLKSDSFVKERSISKKIERSVNFSNIGNSSWWIDNIKVNQNLLRENFV